MMRALVGVFWGGQCPPKNKTLTTRPDAVQKTSTTRVRQKLKNRVDDALRGRFWDPPLGHPKNASRSPKSLGNSAFFAKKYVPKRDGLRKPNLEPAVGEPTGSAAYDAPGVAKARAGAQRRLPPVPPTPKGATANRQPQASNLEPFSPAPAACAGVPQRAQYLYNFRGLGGRA